MKNKPLWEQKFEYDVVYAQNISFLEDVRILLYTAKKVILREGIAHKNEVTMSEFLGSNR